MVVVAVVGIIVQHHQHRSSRKTAEQPFLGEA
jgi:hypothetical protein